MTTSPSHLNAEEMISLLINSTGVQVTLFQSRDCAGPRDVFVLRLYFTFKRISKVKLKVKPKWI